MRGQAIADQVGTDAAGEARGQEIAQRLAAAVAVAKGPGCLGMLVLVTVTAALVARLFV